MCFPGNLSCRGRGGYRRCRADPREAGFGGPIRRGVSFRESGNRRLASWPVQWRVGKEKRRVGPASWSNRQAGSSAAGWPECRCRPHVRSFPTWTPLRPRLPASASDPGRKPHPNHLLCTVRQICCLLLPRRERWRAPATCPQGAARQAKNQTPPRAAASPHALTRQASRAARPPFNQCRG